MIYGHIVRKRLLLVNDYGLGPAAVCIANKSRNQGSRIKGEELSRIQQLHG